MDEAVTQPAIPVARRTESPGARRVVISIVGILGLLGSLLAFYIVRDGARDQLENQFRQRASDRVRTIERELNAGIVVVESLAAFIRAEPTLDSTRFRIFTAPLLAQYPSIRAVGYNRRVMAADRAAYEAAAQLEGAVNYRITEPSEEGVRVAGDRAEYVAVRYIEPHAGNEQALGLDIAAETLRREALSRAIATGNAAMTGGVSLVQESGSSAGVLICVPVRSGSGLEQNEEIIGFAVGVFLVSEMIETAIMHLEPAGVDVRVIDATTRPEQLLHFHSSRTRLEPHIVKGDQSPALNRLHEIATIEEAGRRWTIVCEPTGGFLAGWATRWSIIVLVFGLLVTVLIVTAISRLTMLGARLQTEVLERERNRLAYEHLVGNAPVCIHEIDLDGRLTDMNPAGLKMIGAHDRSDIQGMRYTDAVTETDRAKVQAMLDLAMIGSAREFEFAGSGSMEGRAFASLVMPGRAHDGSICKLVGVSQDITKRRRAEMALEANQSRLQLLHAIAIGVNSGMPTEKVIAMVVRNASEFFPLLRIAYSTIDAAGMLTVRESVEPAGMQSLKGSTADLLLAPAYLNALRNEGTLRVSDIAQDPRLEALAEAMAAGGTRAILDVPLRHSDELLGLLCFDAPTPHEWTEHEVRTLEEIADHLTALIREARTEQERRLAVEALRVSEARQSVILHSAPIVLYVASIKDWSAIWLSEQVADVAGFAPARFIEDPEFWESRIHPSDHGQTMQAMEEMIARERITTEYRWKHADGSYRWIRDQRVLVRDGSGMPMEIVGTWTDITGHKQADRRQTLMMRELDHRVKNNLAAVLALAEQSLATSTSLEAFHESYIGRIRALVRTHEALASTRWEGVELRQIVLLTLAPYCGQTNDRLRINGADVLLPARVTTPICMAIHELATNAAKYGSLSEPTGAIEVSWTFTDDGSLKLLWIERHGPPVEEEPTPGYGISLVEGLIGHELRGTVDLRFDPAGLICAITIPAASLQAEPARPHDQPVPEAARAR